MSSFTKLPALIAQPPSYKLFKVPQDFEYHVGHESSLDVAYVPKGFITDGASIPKIFWPLIGGPLGPYAPAAVVHDFIYKYQLRDREEADRIFLEAMGVLGVAWWRRRSMWLAVRVAGWRPWNRYTKELEEVIYHAPKA